MPTFYALVDAMPGQEAPVESALLALDNVQVVRVKERSNDFLIRFQQPSFDVVDDFLQTHVRQLAGVLGVEVVTDWDSLGIAAREARLHLDG